MTVNLDLTQSLELAQLPVPELDPAMLAAAQEPRLSLFWGPRVPTRSLLAMYTLLAVRGERPVLLDGGNRFDGYFVARLARHLSPLPEAALDRMQLSRAFTCFQLAELIAACPARQAPVFVLDLLDTFYDESVPIREIERLLGNVVHELKRLAEVGPVVVGAREPYTASSDRWRLLDTLQSAADSTWTLHLPVGETPEQPRLL